MHHANEPDQESLSIMPEVQSVYVAPNAMPSQGPNMLAEFVTHDIMPSQGPYMRAGVVTHDISRAL